MNAAILFLAALMFQGVPGDKPIIDNERVTVWDATQTAGKLPYDSVIVSLTGESATYLAKNAPRKSGGRSILIALKDHTVAPLPNKSGYQLAFPRPGSKKLLENKRVIIWDYTWTPGVATPMHFHDKDVVVTYLENGTLQSTTPDGRVVMNEYAFGNARFNLANRIHTETLVKGKQHAIIVELK
ncbi:MAG: hypothetical protein ACRD5L_17100 [Bryobacteraceae bacterium]